MKVSSMFWVAALVGLLSSSNCLAQIETGAKSKDGTQQGRIEVSPDKGIVSSSSSSQGERSASSSSVATIGPDSAQAGFSAQGDSQGVSQEVVVSKETAEKPSSSPSPSPTPSPSPSPSPVPSPVPSPAAPKQEPAVQKQKAPVVVEQKAPAVSKKLPERVCVVKDEAAYKEELKRGIEVTFVSATSDGRIKIVTAVEKPHASSKSVIVTEYIPEEIKQLCAVSYTDLGLEERAGDGFSTLSSHESSVHFTSPQGSADIADAIRSSFYKSICRQSFAKYLFVNECKKYHGGL